MPDRLNVTAYRPPWPRRPESNEPSTAVTVWTVASRFVQATVSPGATSTVGGRNSKPWMTTFVSAARAAGTNRQATAPRARRPLPLRRTKRPRPHADCKGHDQEEKRHPSAHAVGAGGRELRCAVGC